MLCKKRNKMPSECLFSEEYRKIFFVPNPIMFHGVMFLGEETVVCDSNSMSFWKPHLKSKSISLRR